MMATAVIRLVDQVRSLDRTLLGQGIRYAIAGAFVAVVYILTTLCLSNVVGLHFQLALAIGFLTAVTTHFFAQRYFVWRLGSDYALSAARQATLYVPITIGQYAFTALTTSVLPSALGVPTDAVYLVTAACVTLATFVLLRTRVFHAGEREP
jgi:putative flippase GtrA